MPTSSSTPPLPRRSSRRARLLVLLLVWFLGQTVVTVWDGLRDSYLPADLGVVLGNQVLPNGTPSPRLAARLDRALELYREGAVRFLLVSGGLGREGHPEGTVMARYLVAKGVPETAIFVDDDGDNTWLTARHTRERLQASGLTSVIVITSYFHIPRCRLALARHGVGPVYGAHARIWEWRDLYSLVREFPAVYRYLIRPLDP